MWKKSWIVRLFCIFLNSVVIVYISSLENNLSLCMQFEVSDSNSFILIISNFP